MIDFCINWISVIWEFATKVFYFVPSLTVKLIFWNGNLEGWTKILYTISMFYFLFLFILTITKKDNSYEKWWGFYTVGIILGVCNLFTIGIYLVIILAIYLLLGLLTNVVELFIPEENEQEHSMEYEYQSVLRKFQK